MQVGKAICTRAFYILHGLPRGPFRGLLRGIPERLLPDLGSCRSLVSKHSWNILAIEFREPARSHPSTNYITGFPISLLRTSFLASVDQPGNQRRHFSRVR